MDAKTCAILAELNRAFYAEFATDFARTRRSWPPGFHRILPHLRPAANVLDLGCGNGRLLTFLAGHGWHGTYVGVDASPALLAVAEEAAGALSGIVARFVLADLLDPAWPAALGGLAPDVILALAVLHHIPGATNRARFVADCAGLLGPGGLLILTTWQFMTSPRLRSRILPWETVGLSADQLEPGDYLVSWGEGRAGRRYCAFIEPEALNGLAARAGLETVDTFFADGYEGNLNFYGVYARRVTAR